jgi:hypothetical protein
MLQAYLPASPVAPGVICLISLFLYIGSYDLDYFSRILPAKCPFVNE